MTFVATPGQIGEVDLSTIDLVAPGYFNLRDGTGSGRRTQLGDIVTGWDPTLGGGEFIYLAVPTSTAVAAGLLVGWDKDYKIVSLPTTANSGRPAAAAINAVSSNASSVQYTWFQIQGKASVLKTAVTVSPDSRLFLSGTAGRFYVTASAGKQILGARTINGTTVTSTTSTVLVMLNRPVVEGA